MELRIVVCGIIVLLIVLAIGIVACAHVKTVVEVENVADRLHSVGAYIPLGAGRWGEEKTVLEFWLGLSHRAVARQVAYTVALFLLCCVALIVRLRKG